MSHRCVLEHLHKNGTKRIEAYCVACGNCNRSRNHSESGVDLQFSEKVVPSQRFYRGRFCVACAIRVCQPWWESLPRRPAASADGGLATPATGAPLQLLSWVLVADADAILLSVKFRVNALIAEELL